MHNENENIETRPRRAPHGPGVPGEKPKDFKNTIKKLVKSLHKYNVLILISIVLAIFGAIFSIVGPNKISDITDEISKGLIVDRTSIEELSKKITVNLNEENLKNISINILDLNINENKIREILMDDSISSDDKENFNEMLTNGSPDITKISPVILEKLLETTSYDGTQITKEDKLKYLELTSSKEPDANMISDLPESIQKVIFKEFTYKKVKITTNDQVEYLKVMSTITDFKDGTKIYKKLDKLPKNILKVIEPKMNTKKIKEIVMLLLTIYLISALFNFIQGFIMATVSNSYARDLRTAMSKKSDKLPLRYFDRSSKGDILSRLTNDVDTIGMSMQQSLSSLVGAITLFISTIIMMFITNYQMALAAILSSMLGFLGMSIIMSRSQKYFKRRQIELGKLNGHIEEIYSAHYIVKAYNGEEDAKEKFDELNKSVFECNRKSQFLAGIIPPMMGFIGNFSYVAVCVVGAVLVMNDSITFGVIVAFMLYARLFTSPLSQIAQGVTQIQTTAAASERVFEFLEEEEMEAEDALEKKLTREEAKGNIEFKHVKFGYEKDKTIIKDFSCNVKSGQKIAIVGPTGAGKTTMVNLLMKFYDIDSGDIIIDGVSIKDLKRENVHDLFTMVLQDTWLFNGTIRDNVKYNEENITDEDIWNALDIVGVDHFVKTLPNTLNYEINDNDEISAGQKQLLTIARGMIKNAPFLILDEATSSVDTRTEELVQIAMDKLTVGKTSFIIAHRLSTIKNADLILVMKDGNIIEQGSHTELLEKKGFYSELYNSQFEN